MSSFHLRPVSDPSPSPSPTASTTPPGDNSPPLKGPSALLSSPSTSANGRLRRPFSPSSLRDVDLSQGPDMPPRKYPAPPSGHDLMAMFPPAPPDNFPEMRPGPTSGYFQRQERAFFAQAGKEIVRVRVEIDVPHHGDTQPKSRVRENSAPRPWPPPGAAQPITILHHSPTSASAAPSPYPHPNSRPPQRGPVPVTPAPLFPITAHATPTPHPPNLHPHNMHQPGVGLRTPPQDASQPGAANPGLDFQPQPQSEEYQDSNPDEAWRRPMPYAERRRAGKHTRRVVVRT